MLVVVHPEIDILQEVSSNKNTAKLRRKLKRAKRWGRGQRKGVNNKTRMVKKVSENQPAS
jgi:hypothetical protein